jgi:hypothetical protein
MGGQPSSCARVGWAKADENQARVGEWKSSRPDKKGPPKAAIRAPRGLTRMRCPVFYADLHHHAVLPDGAFALAGDGAVCFVRLSAPKAEPEYRRLTGCHRPAQ